MASSGCLWAGLTSVPMEICIVMPVVNEGEALFERLQALKPLRERGVKVFVVDGGSTDATWAIARAHADQVLLAPRGRAAQMNAGARASTAEVLLFLHADTVLPPQADALIRQALTPAAQDAGPGSHWGRFDVHIDGPHPMLRVVEAMMNGRSRLTGIATGDQALFITRSAFDAVGGFAPIPLMEDVELCSRLKRTGPAVCLRERVHTSARRWEKHGVWRTIGLMWWLRAAYFFGTSAEALALRYGYPPAAAPAHAAVSVLAKAPVAGLAKTRLIPALGAKGAALAQRQFTRQILHTARSAALGPVSLWCAPDAQHRFFRAVRRSVDTCLPQPEGDLGHRMGVAFVYHFAGQPPAAVRRHGHSASGAQQPLPLLLVGTDCPALTPGHLQQAAQALQQHDVVLIPAEDGGYVLIGMRRWVPEVFEDITWSTDQVLIQTRQRLRDARASWKELPTLWDVDEPADWSRLQSWLHL